jgi:dCMP deaminase
MDEPSKVLKREDYISWDEYFMGVAMLSAMRSKDPSTQVGACIVSPNNKIVGTGYNGFPNGCNDDTFPWGRDGGRLDTKYAYVVHAELNAILNSNGPVHECTIYVALFPCEECAKAIIQSGIKRVVYNSDKYSDTDGVKASKLMLSAAGVVCDKYYGKSIVGNDYSKQDIEIVNLKKVIRVINSTVSWSMDYSTIRSKVLDIIAESGAIEQVKI